MTQIFHIPDDFENSQFYTSDAVGVEPIDITDNVIRLVEETDFKKEVVEEALTEFGSYHESLRVLQTLRRFDLYISGN